MSFDSLPDELFLAIFQFLLPEELFPLTRVSRRWRELALDQANFRPRGQEDRSMKVNAALVLANAVPRPFARGFGVHLYLSPTDVDRIPPLLMKFGWSCENLKHVVRRISLYDSELTASGCVILSWALGPLLKNWELYLNDLSKDAVNALLLATGPGHTSPDILTLSLSNDISDDNAATLISWALPLARQKLMIHYLGVRYRPREPIVRPIVARLFNTPLPARSYSLRIFVCEPDLFTENASEWELIIGAEGIFNAATFPHLETLRCPFLSEQQLFANKELPPLLNLTMCGPMRRTYPLLQRLRLRTHFTPDTPFPSRDAPFSKEQVPQLVEFVDDTAAESPEVVDYPTLEWWQPFMLSAPKLELMYTLWFSLAGSGHLHERTVFSGIPLLYETFADVTTDWREVTYVLPSAPTLKLAIRYFFGDQYGIADVPETSYQLSRVQPGDTVRVGQPVMRTVAEGHWATLREECE